jgi:putative hydrolase
MILTADYHTHTPYSHGKNTVEENACVAKEKGLQEIAITDHGYTHVVFGLRRRKIEKYKAECEAASRKYGIKVLVGIEANVRGLTGETDLIKKDYEDFDVFLCGTHICVWYKPFIDVLRFGARNYAVEKLHLNKSEKLKEMNTRAYVNIIKKNPVDVMTHVNYLCKCNSLEVAKAAADYGTYLELSAKKPHFTDEELIEMVQKTSVRFVINSDAHSLDRVGDFALAQEQLKRLDFPLDRIDNIDGRLPKFRLAEYKKRL